MRGTDRGKVSDGLLGVAGGASLYAAEESGDSFRNHGEDRPHIGFPMATEGSALGIHGHMYRKTTKGASSTHSGKHSLA